MSNFQWYRKWRGGKWYKVLSIYDLGRTVIMEWTRYPLASETVLETELW